MYHCELAQKTSRHQAIRRNARDLLDIKSPEWRASIKVLEKAESAFVDIRHSVQALSKLFHCPPSDVAVVTLCNWSASVSKAQAQKNQASVMGACINDSGCPLNVGLLLQPAMSSKRGSLWKEEEAARKVLANANLNMDTCFCIVFDSKVDLREMRPGVFLVTVTLCWGIFWTERIWIAGHQQFAPMTGTSFSRTGSFCPWMMTSSRTAGMCGKGSHFWRLASWAMWFFLGKDDLVEIEDVRDDSIPCFSGQQHSVSRSDRIFQIGESGATSLLASMLDTNAKCILFVDVCAHTGDFLKGFFNILGKGNSGSNHLYMLSFSDDEAKAWRYNQISDPHFSNNFFSERFAKFCSWFNMPVSFTVLLHFFAAALHLWKAEWLYEHMVDHLSQKIGSADSDFKLPGGQALPSERCAESMAMPPQPLLQCFAWSNKKASSGLNSLKTPDKTIRTWSAHSSLASEFNSFLEKARSKYPLDLAGAEPSNTKRATEAQGSVAGTKKLKSGNHDGSYAEAPAGATFPSDQIPATLAYQRAAVSDSQLQLVVAVGPRAFLLNNNESPVLLKAGAIICGFYKGKRWVQRHDKEGKASQEATEKDIQFTLQHSSDFVILGSSFTTLSEVVLAKRAVAPADGHIGFHNLIDEPTAADTKAFKSTQKGLPPLFFKQDDFPVKDGQGDDPPIANSQHQAGRRLAPKTVGEVMALWTCLECALASCWPRKVSNQFGHSLWPRFLSLAHPTWPWSWQPALMAQHRPKLTVPH